MAKDPDTPTTLPPDCPRPTEQRSYGVAAGNNKFGLRVCPFCQSPGVKVPGNLPDNFPNVFEFRDRLSAREYQISGLCQDCQDQTFGVTGDVE